MSQQSVPQESSAHIRIEKMSKTFGDGTIVACEDFNLEIDADEFVVFLGPSGCGKTTALRCISGLERPDSGKIFIDDREVTNLQPKDRDVAFVFQNIALFPHMNVRRNISFGLDMKTDLSSAEKRERVERVAGILGIQDLLDRSPDELSGGQQQRVSLGRAMVMEPEVFLLDEPFSALDANLRDQMRVEVKKLQRQLSTSMVFVTHDQEEAMTLGDTIVIVNDGRIQQIASPGEIYNDPTNQFVAEFIGSPSTNFIDSTVESSDDGLVIANDLFTVPLTDDQRNLYSGEVGADVTLGIRPDHLSVGGMDQLFHATVDVIESLGSKDNVYLSANDHDFAAVVSPGSVERDQDQVNVDINREEIWLFDRSTGNRLL